MEVGLVLGGGLFAGEEEPDEDSAAGEGLTLEEVLAAAERLPTSATTKRLMRECAAAARHAARAARVGLSPQPPLSSEAE
jgi:hypothetical protein